MQGRFTSPDPLLNSARPNLPQSWNRYSYTQNSPLTRYDPTGLYDLNNTCKDNDRKCNSKFNEHAADLNKGLGNLQKKLASVKNPIEKARLEKALKAFGTEGDHNGVTVMFGVNKGGAAGNTTPISDPVTYKETYNVTLDPSMIKSSDDYAVDAAHEGTHIDDINMQLANPTELSDLSSFSREYRGYQTSAWAAKALGVFVL
jgi:hypothetical protein